MNYGCVGIDLGSTRSVIAVSKKGGIEIVDNDASMRENKNVVGFGQSERFIGEQGFAQQKSNYKNTISYFSRFLGLKTYSKNLKDEQKYLTCNLIEEQETQEIYFDANYLKKQWRFTPIQITASYIASVIQMVQKTHINTNEYTISVPNYYTEVEKVAIQNACQIANIQHLHIIKESTAVCLGYGMFRRQEFQDNMHKTVVFIDFGHSKLSAYCASFDHTKCEILEEFDDKDLGARDIDWILANYYSELFQKEHQVGDPMKNIKSRLRLLDAIEKQRKVLSANMDANINCEYLVEDCDLAQCLTRDQFEHIIAPVLGRLENVLYQFRDNLHKKNIQVHEIELIGGASRIPIVQKIIQQVFQLDHLQRTLNASECIAKGCALYCSMKSQFFKTVQYGCFELSSHNIIAQWQDVNKNDSKEVQQNEPVNNLDLFFRGEQVPQMKIIKIPFTKNRINFKVLCIKDEEIKQLVFSFLEPQNPQQQNVVDSYFEIKIILNEAQFIEIYEVKFIQRVLSLNIVNQPNSQHQQDNQNLQVIEHKVHFQQIKLNTLSPQDIQKYQKLEQQLIQQDQNVNLINEKKNELEGYIYSMRRDLQEKYKIYCDNNTMQQLIASLEKTEKWLYGDQITTLDQLTQELINLQKKGIHIINRYNEYQNLNELTTQSIDLITQYRTKLSTMAHLTQNEKAYVLQQCQVLENWLHDVKKQQQKLQYHQDPVVNSQQIQQKYDLFVQNCSPIINKPQTFTQKVFNKFQNFF